MLYTMYYIYIYIVLKKFELLLTVKNSRFVRDVQISLHHAQVRFIITRKKKVRFIIYGTRWCGGSFDAIFSVLGMQLHATRDWLVAPN
jgi:hypothetical protein